MASGGNDSNKLVTDSVETEGCSLVVVELEAHCGELNAAAAAAATAARNRGGLLRALAGRPFFPRLAGMLLDSVTSMARNMKVGAEVQALQDLLERRVTAARGLGCGGAMRRGAVGSGSAMLLEDLAV